ncbi:hypothetical protein BJ508DRAFT_326424 [Ascobolus immersus RN42]|uniref:Uncharacterized protein n=1 Tax=Ascobolus immersus RN42 TaxID=1160509 RepID=A0A3N4I635_ASCIM|nr:hypothetical protein BJ508DRAFT_326424 [Ascobolus immersus RN42]
MSLGPSAFKLPFRKKQVVEQDSNAFTASAPSKLGSMPVARSSNLSGSKRPTRKSALPVEQVSEKSDIVEQPDLNPPPPPSTRGSAKPGAFNASQQSQMGAATSAIQNAFNSETPAQSQSRKPRAVLKRQGPSQKSSNGRSQNGEAISATLPVFPSSGTKHGYRGASGNALNLLPPVKDNGSSQVSMAGNVDTYSDEAHEMSSLLRRLASGINRADEALGNPINLNRHFVSPRGASQTPSPLPQNVPRSSSPLCQNVPRSARSRLRGSDGAPALVSPPGVCPPARQAAPSPSAARPLMEQQSAQPPPVDPRHVLMAGPGQPFIQDAYLNEPMDRQSEDNTTPPCNQNPPAKSRRLPTPPPMVVPGTTSAVSTKPGNTVKYIPPSSPPVVPHKRKAGSNTAGPGKKPRTSGPTGGSPLPAPPDLEIPSQVQQKIVPSGAPKPKKSRQPRPVPASNGPAVRRTSSRLAESLSRQAEAVAAAAANAARATAAAPTPTPLSRRSKAYRDGRDASRRDLNHVHKTSDGKIPARSSRSSPIDEVSSNETSSGSSIAESIVVKFRDGPLAGTPVTGRSIQPRYSPRRIGLSARRAQQRKP